MSNAKQILAMLRSRAEGDDAQFYSIALQVAASEARQGHRDTANELRSAVDAARGAGGVKASIPVSFAAPRGDLEGLLDYRDPVVDLQDVVLSASVSERLNGMLLQQRKRDWLGLLDKHPDLYALAEDWEGISIEMARERGWVEYGWNQGYRLEHLRTATQAQLSMFSECSEEACTICTW